MYLVVRRTRIATTRGGIYAAGNATERIEMKRAIFGLAMFAMTGCAVGPQESPFMSTMDRAYAVDCDIKTLEWTQQRSRLECHE